MKLPLDIALDEIKEHFFNNPEALKQLAILEKHHNDIERIKLDLAKAQLLFKDECAKMSNILELLKVNTYERGNFECFEKTYREVEVIDKKLFFGWLKEHCTPDEIIELLTPPTSKSDLKKFVNRKLESEHDEIPGLDLKAVFTILKTRRKDHGKAKFKKDSEGRDTYKRKRPYGYGQSGRSRPK